MNPLGMMNLEDIGAATVEDIYRWEDDQYAQLRKSRQEGLSNYLEERYASLIDYQSQWFYRQYNKRPLWKRFLLWLKKKWTGLKV